MKLQEYNEAWNTIRSKLTRSEQELIDNTITGAEINHSIIYVVVAFVLGGVCVSAATNLLN